MKTECIFCISDKNVGNKAVQSERILHEYTHWWLLLQPELKRLLTKQAAGILVSKRHAAVVSELTPEELSEALAVYKQSSRILCGAVGVTYMEQETVAFNEGAQAGQTVEHAHIHILPVAQEDPEQLKVRGGLGGAFEALRRERLGQ